MADAGHHSHAWVKVTHPEKTDADIQAHERTTADGSSENESPEDSEMASLPAQNSILQARQQMSRFRINKIRT